MAGAQAINRPKYILIVSQYYHSRHAFVIGTPAEDADYYKQAQAMIEELESHKRVGSFRDGCEIEYGDMVEKYFMGAPRRYNINDAGDIYLIPCWGLPQAMATAREFWIASHRESRSYQRKAVTEAISRCHKWDDVNRIIGNHFTVL